MAHEQYLSLHTAKVKLFRNFEENIATMKKILTILAVAMIAVSCGNGTAKKNAAKIEEQPLCGAYTDQREPTEEEVEMFRAATAENAIVFTPLSVSTQVVAGLNYKFWCRFSDSAANDSGHCWVVIYKDLQGNASVTSVKKEE